MPTYRISSRTEGDTQVEASNWMTALGEGFALGKIPEMDRVACEVLPNGKILVRDLRSGTGYVVMPLDGAEDTEDLETIEDEDLGGVPYDDIHPATLLDELDEILSAVTEEGVIRRTLEAAHARVPAESGSVVLRRPDDRLAFALVTGSAQAALENVTLPADTGIVGFCVRRSIAVSVRDAYADPRFFREADRMTGFETRSVLCVPIDFGGRVFGCLELLNAERGTGFERDDMVTLGAIAHAAGQRLAASAGR
ncbi:MAG: GAF domain-containing protein [Pseudomonadota bacterium]|nr:GAF domain-containing protein [Pseudomonadota bacterium]